MRSNTLLCLPFLFFLCFVSCAQKPPDSETLLLYLRSRSLCDEGRFSEAAEMLAKEKRFVPALVLRGKAEYLSGDLVSAGKSLQKALARQPHNSEAALYQARVFWENGDSGRAEKLIEKLLANNPLDIRALRFASELARERGVSGEAVSAALLDRAVEASETAASEASLVFLGRARLRWIGGNSEGALEDLGRARSMLGRDSPLINPLEKLESVIREVTS